MSEIYDELFEDVYESAEHKMDRIRMEDTDFGVDEALEEIMSLILASKDYDSDHHRILVRDGLEVFQEANRRLKLRESQIKGLDATEVTIDDLVPPEQGQFVATDNHHLSKILANCSSVPVSWMRSSEKQYGKPNAIFPLQGDLISGSMTDETELKVDMEIYKERCREMMGILTSMRSHVPNTQYCQCVAPAKKVVTGTCNNPYDICTTCKKEIL